MRELVLIHGTRREMPHRPGTTSMALPLLKPSKEPSGGVTDRPTPATSSTRVGVLPVAAKPATLEPITPFNGVVLR